MRAVHDAFISHASEDKAAVARPLANALIERGWDVWYDEHELRLGDSLRAKIDQGLTTARYGVVILSQHFFAKRWPQLELEAERPARPVLLRSQVYRDDRGFFSADQMTAMGIADRIVQINHSRSSRGVLRGMHFTVGEPMDKLVRCSRGRIFDVLVDVRDGSPTFGQWEGLELSDTDGLQLYVPFGYAHGFCVLSDVADVQYVQTAYYEPSAAREFRWKDPDVQIGWPPDMEFEISARDARAPMLRDLEHVQVRGRDD